MEKCAVIQRIDTGMYWAGADQWRDSADDALSFATKRDAFTTFIMLRTGAGQVEFDVIEHAGAEPIR